MSKKYPTVVRIDNLEDFQKVYIELKARYKAFNQITTTPRKQPERSFIGLKQNNTPMIGFSLRTPDMITRLMTFIIHAKADVDFKEVYPSTVYKLSSNFDQQFAFYTKNIAYTSGQALPSGDFNDVPQEVVESTPQTYYSHDFTTLVDQIIERKNDLTGLVELIESLEDFQIIERKNDLTELVELIERLEDLKDWN